MKSDALDSLDSSPVNHVTSYLDRMAGDFYLKVDKWLYENAPERPFAMAVSIGSEGCTAKMSLRVYDNGGQLPDGAREVRIVTEDTYQEFRRRYEEKHGLI